MPSGNDFMVKITFIEQWIEDNYKLDTPYKFYGIYYLNDVKMFFMETEVNKNINIKLFEEEI